MKPHPFTPYHERARVRCNHIAVRWALRQRSELGQSTAEYALVLVAVTSMVAVVIAFVSGDGAGMITDLFGAVFAKMRSMVGAG